MGIMEDTDIIVNETHACDRCETIRGRNNVPMKLSEFNQKHRQDPEEYWKDTENGAVFYRRHVVSSNFRCRNQPC